MLPPGLAFRGSAEAGGAAGSEAEQAGESQGEPPGLLPEIPTPGAFAGTHCLDSVSQRSPAQEQVAPVGGLCWPSAAPSPSTLPHHHKMAEPSPGVIRLTISTSLSLPQLCEDPEPISFERPGQGRAKVSRPVGQALPLVLAVSLNWYLYP